MQPDSESPEEPSNQRGCEGAVPQSDTVLSHLNMCLLPTDTGLWLHSPQQPAPSARTHRRLCARQRASQPGERQTGGQRAQALLRDPQTEPSGAS